jgi:hypothetical protein
MGSYLNHVAAKALGQSVTLQPRVPSLFEPPPALRSARLAPFPPLKADSDTRLDSGDSATPQHDWRSRSLSRPETPVASVYDHQSSERQTPGKDQPTVSRITGLKRRQSVPIEPVALSADETERVPPAPDSRAKPRIIPTGAPRTEPARSDAIEPPKWTDYRIATQQRKASPEAEPRSEAISRKEPDVRDAEQRVSARPEVRSVTAPERAEVAAHSLRPAPKKMPTFPRAEARDAEETDGGFNVSVVIGRVNVQAVLPQPAPVRLAHSSPAPLLSLEQYLKQRGGHS